MSHCLMRPRLSTKALVVPPLERLERNDWNDQERSRSVTRSGMCHTPVGGDMTWNENERRSLRQNDGDCGMPDDQDWND